MKYARLAVIICLVLVVNGCARVPKRTMTAPPPPMVQVPASAGFYYTVARGETLYRIAKNHRVDVKELMRVNGITDPSQVETGRRLFVPAQSFGPRPQPSFVLGREEVLRIVGGPYKRYKWLTITLHHSGTEEGCAKSFNKDHLKRRMGGLFYHFVIGNGSGSGDGSIEVGWRWKRQVKANRANDLQICVVGDFERQQVTEAQYGSLLQLVKVLMEQYNIPKGRIRGHGDIPGKHTACPGKNFPFQRLLNDLK